jgi:phosphoglycerol transferase MdoB-like AlkP superfamily enzyme
MNFLNKIGLRNAAKYLIMLAVVMYVCIYGLKFMNIGSVVSNTTIMKLILGTIFLSISNIILYYIAKKSKDFRLLAVFLSAIILFINIVLFVFTLYNEEVYRFLSFVVIMEILITSIGLIIVINLESKKLLKTKND